MPRTNLDKPKFPPINNLRAAILERKFVAGYTWADLAKVALMSEPGFRKLVTTKDPEDWPKKVRDNVCRYLQIKVTQTVIDEAGKS